ncbi:hypothetical protein ZYGR_0AL00500 [Zygosaccharomyces rouxii]|uniref:Uncharacterized protein n=1 Tax=Zygosaccharomyces rouxii TaxID=4956 RepID=A0A1Q3AF40_ZYGRO|nr:hypothetical protein ZYGR_0AL00500 [Zygosaccharomyces rouxii]
MLSSDDVKQNQCTCNCGIPTGKTNDLKSRPLVRGNVHRHRRPKTTRQKNRFRFTKSMEFEGTDYNLITSVEYLNEKYDIRKSHYIEKFIKCIHKKIDHDVNKISDKYIQSLGPWVKIKFFLLLVTLSQRGGPEYWMDKDQNEDNSTTNIDENKDDKKHLNQHNHNKVENDSKKNAIFSLTEHIMRQNINQDFTESAYDENYVFSSIWANFMEGLMNHYLEQVIVPHSEMKVCQQLYKPMMKIISLYNEYNELMEKSEHNGFLPAPGDEKDPLKLGKSVAETYEVGDCVTQERLQRAQKLLWQARQDIPKTISKELTLLSEMYSTLSADEQDYELDEFVCCAEEYVELEYLPSLIDVLFRNCGSINFWKIMIVLEPFFYYIEDVGDEGDTESQNGTNDEMLEEGGGEGDELLHSFKPDPRVIILEKICEVAARQKWI